MTECECGARCLYVSFGGCRGDVRILDVGFAEHACAAHWDDAVDRETIPVGSPPVKQRPPKANLNRPGKRPPKGAKNPQGGSP